MRKGQAALEYLFTYGWAFLAILITLGTLMYFGIFDTSQLRSSDCTFPPGAVCDDYIISESVALCGDVDGDLAITNADATAINDHISSPQFSPEQEVLADVNADGFITGPDAGLVTNRAGGDPTPFPADPCEIPVTRFLLRNSFAADLEVLNVTIREPRVPTVQCWPASVPGVYPKDWASEEILGFSCIIPDDLWSSSETYDFTVRAAFRQEGHTYEHNITGKVRANAQ